MATEIPEANIPITREVLSMDVDPLNITESEYRIILGDQIKYIVVDANTYDPDVLSFPPDFLAKLPDLASGEWTRARIFRRSEDLCIELSYASLAGVPTRWHPNVVDILSVTLEERLSTCVRVVKYSSKTAVAKIARFEFEIPLVEKETAIYQAIDGQGIGPAFLGHLSEHGQIMGLLIEKLNGRRGNIEDLETCQEITKCLHSFGIVHGDLNRHNYIITPTGAALIDFENATLNGSQEAMEREYLQIPEQLMEKTGRGGVSIPESEWSD